jgi:hypothetical protein
VAGGFIAAGTLQGMHNVQDRTEVQHTQEIRP